MSIPDLICFVDLAKSYKSKPEHVLRPASKVASYHPFHCKKMEFRPWGEREVIGVGMLLKSLDEHKDEGLKRSCYSFE